MAQIKRLSEIEKDIPKKLREEYFISNYSRYPITQLLTQAKEKDLSTTKNILVITAIKDHNGSSSYGISDRLRIQSSIHLKSIRNGYKMTVAEPSTYREIHAVN